MQSTGESTQYPSIRPSRPSPSVLSIWPYSPATGVETSQKVHEADRLLDSPHCVRMAGCEQGHHKAKLPRSMKVEISRAWRRFLRRLSTSGSARPSCPADTFQTSQPVSERAIFHFDGSLLCRARGRLTRCLSAWSTAKLLVTMTARLRGQSMELLRAADSRSARAAFVTSGCYCML